MWLEQQLTAIGVEPGVPSSPAPSFRQPFEVTTAITVGAGTAMTIDGAAVAAGGFVPASFSAKFAVSGAPVAVGWGVTAPDLKVDDYRGKQVKGKIAVVHRFVPGTRAFDSAEARGRYGDLQWKAFVARQHGAIGLVVVDDGDPKVEEAPLPALNPTAGDAGIPVVIVTRAAAASLAKAKQVAITVALDPVHATTANVIGVIRAGAATKREGVVVIGAHYDHLGMGGPDALDTEPGIHNGADDNASGTAALLEVARTLVAHRAELARDVYVMAFSGEEMGILGSTHYVAHPVTQAPVVAMLNMDMVGRMRANQLSVLGSESAAEWGAIVPAICERAAVACGLSGTGYGPSDHMAFYSKGAPVLHFFTGGHLDYHKASDDSDKINAIGAARVAQIVADTAVAVAGRDPLTYKKLAPPPSGGDVRVRGASLGTIPSYADDPTAPPGMVVSDVVPDGPAAKAGVKAGDRIVDIGGTEIRSVHDLMFVLTAHKPGQKTTITLVRDGKRITVDAVFGAPRSRR